MLSLISLKTILSRMKFRHFIGTMALLLSILLFVTIKKVKLTKLCYIVISESTQHDTIAIHLFQRKHLEFLTEHCGGQKPDRVYYMSDGCAAQYKNCKHFTNLCFHVERLS